MCNGRLAKLIFVHKGKKSKWFEKLITGIHGAKNQTFFLALILREINFDVILFHQT